MPDEPDNNILLDGMVGLFRQVDLETWKDTSVLVSFDSDLQSLGFIFLGDFMCSALAHSILRAYVHPKEHTSVTILVGVKDDELNVFGLVLESRFTNGATATTTTSPAFRDIPAAGIHRKVCPWLGVYELFHQHQAHLNELRTLNGDPEPLGQTLRSVAEALDASSVRMNQL